MALSTVVAMPPARAQDSAETLYREALASEQDLRADSNPPTERWLSVIRAYEAIVRRYPASGYSDNALWQAASLARDLYAQNGDFRERDRAARLLRSLVSEYPSSKLVPAAVVEVTRLAGAGIGPDATSPSGGEPTPLESPQGLAPRPTVPATVPLTRSAPIAVRAVTRVVLPEVVRIIVDLDGEVRFHHERIDNPSRVFVDLQGTQVAPALRNSVLTYDDDIVRQVRIGRHPANTTRIVLDVENLAKYSFFILYEPFRLVIDCERSPGAISPALATVQSAERPRTTVNVLPATVPMLPTLTASPPTVPSVGVTDSAIQDSDVFREATARPPPSPPSANARGGFSIARQLGLGASRIVIDPGHGGHDPGAIKNGVSEAELVLDVALRLEKLLLKQPGAAVVLTRRADTYVPLEERTAIANREGADLFLSIHANASGNIKTRGVETYFLNFAATPDAAAVAARENAPSGRTMSSLPDLVKAITLSNKRDESRDFAAEIQRALFRQLRTAGMRNLGVKQAPFVVLIGAEMPSILAEVAFLTNRQDEQLLKRASYRQRIAEALLNGILRYQQTLKTTGGPVAQQE
jgi:N-acetylmuramoyl-L-alanine amidase